MTTRYSDHPITPLADAWIAVALSRDLPPGSAIPAILGGRELALWRTETGIAQAWADRCPHRGMRLSFGFVRGESLSCLYHGWRYGVGGFCTRIPAHPDLVPPKTIYAATYPVAEAGGMIFVRMGETDLPAPVFPGAWRGARSLTVDAPAAMVASNIDDEEEAGRLVVIQPVLDDRCRLHIAVSTEGPTDLDRTLAACLWAEVLRTRLEPKSAA